MLSDTLVKEMVLQAPFSVISDIVMLLSCHVFHGGYPYACSALIVSSSSQTAEGDQTKAILTVMEGSGSRPWIKHKSGHLSCCPLQIIWDESEEICPLISIFWKC